jgi:hypothetical protein
MKTAPQILFKMIVQKEMPAVSLPNAGRARGVRGKTPGAALGPGPDLLSALGDFLGLRPPWATSQTPWFSVGGFLLQDESGPSCNLPALTSAPPPPTVPKVTALSLFIRLSMCDFSTTGH